MIRAATTEDAARIADIYNHYVLHSTITFEEEAVSVDQMRDRISEVLSELPWLVWIDGQTVQGFAYASRWKGRRAYRYSVESTIYLTDDARGAGIGSKLYGELLAKLQERDLHAVMGGIALPNDASVALHENLGFEKVAHLSEVGWKFGRWIDVGYWQRLLRIDGIANRTRPFVPDR